MPVMVTPIFNEAAPSMVVFLKVIQISCIFRTMFNGFGLRRRHEEKASSTHHQETWITRIAFAHAHINHKISTWYLKVFIFGEAQVKLAVSWRRRLDRICEILTVDGTLFLGNSHIKPRSAYCVIFHRAVSRWLFFFHSHYFKISTLTCSIALTQKYSSVFWYCLFWHFCDILSLIFIIPAINHKMNLTHPL